MARLPLHDKGPKRLFPRVTPILLAGLLVVASMPANAIDTELQIINSPPTVISVTPQGLTSPLFPITPEAGTTKTFTIEIVVEDLNGCNDIDNVQVTIKDPADATKATATLTERDSCSALTLATYTYTHTVDFYDSPGDYNVEIVAKDSESKTGSNLLDLTSFRVEELVALNVEAATLSFGSTLEPGSTSSTQTVNIVNQGNVQLDTQVSGTVLSHATSDAEIPRANITWSLASNMASPTTLTDSPTTASGFNLDEGASSSRALYWQVDVPKALPPGSYTGSLTIGAVKST